MGSSKFSVRKFTILFFFLYPGSQFRAGMHCLLGSDPSSAIAAFPLAQEARPRLPGFVLVVILSANACLCADLHGMQWPLERRV